MLCKAEFRNGNPCLELTGKAEEDRKILDKIANGHITMKWRLSHTASTNETELVLEFEK